jgi:peptidoglycan/xylan/chitin deacetylase (PgdA/CDA1 family)
MRMRIRGIARLKGQWSRIIGQLRPGPTILLYHRIAQPAVDPQLVAVTPAHFEEQILALRRHYRVVSVSELVSNFRSGRSNGSMISLTFDDGYADNAEVALPLLQKHAVPAMFYLASGFVGSAREFLSDDLERLLLTPPQCPDALHLTIGGKPFACAMRSRDAEPESIVSDGEWNITSKTDPEPRHRAYRALHALLRASPPAEREQVLDQLRSQCGDHGPARLAHRAMSWDQARDMASCELVELGAHTVNHPWLSSLTLTEQRKEIVNSKRVLEQQIGRPMTSFAYPYGTRESYTTETVAMVKGAGFGNACSNFRERICGHTDPLEIPRMVVRDWDGDQFLQRLTAGRL